MNLSTGEGPVHREEVLDRFRDTMGLSRLSPAFRDRINAVIADIERYQFIRLRGDFIWPEKDDSVVVRGARRDGSVRPFERIAPEEIIEAVRLAVVASPGGTVDEIVQWTRNAFGLNRVTPTIRFEIEVAIERAILTKRIRKNDDGFLPVRPRIFSRRA